MSAPLINISQKQAWFFAFFLVFFEFLTYITNDMIMPGMLTVIKTFRASEAQVSNSLTAYVLGGASLQLFIGPISDTMGRRPVMLFGCVLFILFTLMLAVSQSMPQFLIGRFFQGMGLCFLVIGYAVIQELFSEMDAVRLIALMANAATLAPLMGPLLGAFFILHFPWRYMYALISICAVFSCYGLWLTMPETVGVTRKNGTKMPRAPLSFKMIYQNYMQLLTDPSFMLGVVALGFLSSPCLVWIGLSPIILMTDAKLTLIQYALWQIPFFSACILGSMALRKLSHTHTLKQLIFLGSSIATLSLLSMSILPFFFHGSYLSLMPGLTLYGFGLGFTSAPLTRHLLFSTAVAKGTTNALIQVIDMSLLGLFTFIGNILYKTQNNTIYGGYCGILGIVYFILLSWSLYKKK